MLRASMRDSIIILCNMALICWGIVLWVMHTPPAPAPNYAITPRCSAVEVVVRPDSIWYEVVRLRGERCKLTLPEDARSASLSDAATDTPQYAPRKLIYGSRSADARSSAAGGP